MKTAIYLARIADRESKGIINKVRNTAAALNELGFTANAVIFHEHWLKGSVKVALRLFLAKEDLIILRSDHHTMLMMFFPMLLARAKGKKIVVDIANPVRVAAKEVDGTRASSLPKILKKLLLYVTFPLSLFPANRILEYGHDSFWFTLGVKRKVRIVGNGAAVKSIPFRSPKPKFNGGVFNLIGVAHLAYWHGYDRLIRSIHAYNNSKITNKININFYIVGDGFERDSLARLAKELDLENQVQFLGVMENDDLSKCFDDIHAGVCSLATFRKNVSYISDLKSKEYSARGIPFILANEDNDFPSTLPFVYRCENNDSLIDMGDIVEWYATLDRKHDDFSLMRDLAEKKFDYSVKVKKDILSIYHRSMSKHNGFA